LPCVHDCDLQDTFTYLRHSPPSYDLLSPPLSYPYYIIIFLASSLFCEQLNKLTVRQRPIQRLHYKQLHSISGKSSRKRPFLHSFACSNFIKSTSFSQIKIQINGKFIYFYRKSLIMPRKSGFFNFLPTSFLYGRIRSQIIRKYHF